MAERLRASVIIPAHNEASVISRTLTALLAEALPGEFDVVVVCNACTDATEQAVRAFPSPDVRALRVREPSKSAALNAGDAAARAYPRLYLDADVELSTDGARRMVEALATTDCATAVPVYRLEGCRRLARAYWLEWQRRNPVPAVGTGCFGLSQAARSSFTEFPGILGDDIWVATNFGPRPVPGAATQVRVARTVPAIMRRRIRVARGNHELRRVGHTVSLHQAHLHSPSLGDVRGRREAGPSGEGRGRGSLAGVGMLIGTHAVASLWGRAFPSGRWGQDQTTRR